MRSFQILEGDALAVLRTLPDESVNCCVTSPPYWGLRDYGVPGQLGLERTPEEYVARMVDVFREVRRVVRADGVLWLNLGDSYARMQEGNVPQSKNRECVPPVMAGRVKNAGLKPKDLVGIPWRVAFALQSDGWYLRSDIIWAKPNPMPESVTDRPTKAHEYLFLMAKSERYWYDADAIREPLARIWGSNNGGGMATGYDEKARIGGHERHVGYPLPNPLGRNRRTVWEIATQPFPGSHFAVMPEALVAPCIKAGCPEGGTVLDPFCGSGTVPLVALKLGRSAVGIELNPEYIKLAERRLRQHFSLFSGDWRHEAGQFCGSVPTLCDVPEDGPGGSSTLDSPVHREVCPDHSDAQESLWG